VTRPEIILFCLFIGTAVAGVVMDARDFRASEKRHVGKPGHPGRALARTAARLHQPILRRVK
jgi:hypothetical protein